MDVGRHCTTCGQLDFLPFDCRRCGKVLCSDHRVHECDESASALSTPKSEAPHARLRTQASAQTIAAGSAAKAASRSGTSTQTATETRTRTKTQTRSQPKAPSETVSNQSNGQRLGSGPVKSERAVAALDRLKQLVGVGAKPSRPKVASGSNVRNGASAELRRAATGDQRVPQSDRAYFYIERTAHEVRDPLTQSMSTRPSKTVAMFFDRESSAGQILDRASRQLAVPHASLLVEGRPVDLAAVAAELPQKLTLVAV